MAPKDDINLLRDLSFEIDNLFETGRKNEASALLEEAIIKAKAIDEAYLLFFESERIGYLENDRERQLG